MVNLAAGALFPKGFSRATRFPWPLIRVGDLVTLNYGKALPEKMRRPGEVPVYGTNGQCGWHDIALARGPGIILGRKGQGPLGVEWCEREFWVIDTAYFVGANTDSIDLKYFYYITSYVGLNHLKDGTSNPGLSRDTFYSQVFPVPPVEVQHRIADILSTYDDLIENNTKRIKILEEMARSLYREWFVNFRFPGHEKVKLVDSLGGKVPERWTAGTLGDVVTLQRGFDLPERERRSGSVPIVSSSGTTGTHDTAKIDAPGIVTGRYGTLGEVYFIREPFWPLNTTLFVRDFKGSNPYWLLYLLRSLNFSQQNTAGAVPGINRNALHLLDVHIAPRELQARFGSLVDPLLQQVEVMQRRNKVLAGQREILLPRLISGEIDVTRLEAPGA